MITTALGHAVGLVLFGMWKAARLFARPAFLLFGLRLLGVPVEFGWRTVIGAECVCIALAPIRFKALKGVAK